jgi:hypothetical protein
MNDTSNYFDDFSAIRKANEMISRFTPVFEAIDSFRERGSFTVREIGEYLMGDAYHQKHTVYRMWYNEKEVRTDEAMSMTALITSAVCKMVDSGAVVRRKVKDTSHPYTIEVDGYYYCDQNGKALPDTTIVTLPDGSEYEVETKNLRGVRRVKGTHTETKYSTYSMYTFAD